MLLTLRGFTEGDYRGASQRGRVMVEGHEDIVEGVTSDMVLVAEYFRTYHIALFK
jgi:hypothetical protein